jgi:hypothetical protein
MSPKSFGRRQCGGPRRATPHVHIAGGDLQSRGEGGHQGSGVLGLQLASTATPSTSNSMSPVAVPQSLNKTKTSGGGRPRSRSHQRFSHSLGSGQFDGWRCGSRSTAQRSDPRGEHRPHECCNHRREDPPSTPSGVPEVTREEIK